MEEGNGNHTRKNLVLCKLWSNLHKLCKLVPNLGKFHDFELLHILNYDINVLNRIGGSAHA